jgi:hypothetical protein
MVARKRLLWTRNLACALVNGLFTLIILLIAPLGLLAVVINTVLVMVSTLAVGVAGDRIVLWLLQGADAYDLPPSSLRSLGGRRGLEVIEGDERRR